MRSAEGKLPVISNGTDWAKAGALLTYAPDFYEMWRRSATYVHKILQGSKTGELAIEQPTRLELVVNMKTAKALAITVPNLSYSVLIR